MIFFVYRKYFSISISLFSIKLYKIKNPFNSFFSGKKTGFASCQVRRPDYTNQVFAF